MAMVKRPVNIQGTRDFVMYLRGELIGQPYLTLVEKADVECGSPRARTSLRLLSYNIRRGGAGREDALLAVIRPCDPDSSSSRKPRDPAVIETLAAGAAMPHWAAMPSCRSAS